MKPVLELDPRRRPPGPRAGAQGRAAGGRAGPSHTTVSVERATLRLAGLAGADHERVPWVNHLVDAVRDEVGLEHGVTTPVFDALRRGEAPDLLDPRPEGRQRLGLVPPARGPGRRPRAQAAARRAVAPRHPDHRPAARHPRPARQAPRRPEAAPVDLPHRRHRRHLRGHPAGPGRRPRGRRRHRRHPLDRAVAARLRARGRHPRGVSPAPTPPRRTSASCAPPSTRRQQGARPLRPADQLRLRPVHARDRGPGRARAARHDAQRLDVRHPLPRHQPDPHLRRPALLPPDPRPRRHHHQHRRGQLPHHRRRRRGRAHGHGEPAAQRVLRQGGRARGLAARPRATPSRSTPRSPTASGWSSPTRCSPASSSPTRR